MTQAELNIGTIGHVDHGKSTLVQALTGKFPDTHSEELKRGITIKLGYSQATFYKCPKCPEPQCYSTQPKCPNCGSEGAELRKVSFLDSPGHETLMATVIAASSIMDGALFVIAANEECPQPQTVEHLMILEAAGIKNVIVVQNKVDLVTEEKAKTHYNQIKEFLKGSLLENAPVIPVVANVGGNLDALIQTIQETIPLPSRSEGQIPRMLVARSFDVNKPGTDIPKLSGGVLGGSIVQGEFKVGQEIMILPGSLRMKKNKEYYEPLTTKIAALFAEKEKLTEARPGGLVAVGTQLDPALTHSDSLVGNVIGLKDSMPPVYSEITVEIKQMPRLLQNFPSAFKPNEPLVLGAGTATTVGFVIEQKKKGVKIVLKKPICLDKEGKIAVLRRAENRWRLYGTARIVQ